MSSTEDSSNPGNLGRSSVKSSSTPQDEYYRYMLMDAKLTGTDKDILKAKSEQDKVEIAILRKLVKVGESTPEFNQVVDLTGTKNRFEQARILAEIVYEKQKAEKILSFYAPTPGEVNTIFTDTDTNARNLRAGGGAVAGLSGSSPVSASASSAGVGGAI